jgi:hypothetical protein
VEEPCTHEALSATFTVRGDCGPEGLLHLTAPRDRCALEVSGAEALGLPSSGRILPMENVADAALYDFEEGPWELSDERPWSSDGGAGTVPGWRRCAATREPAGLLLRCEDWAQPPGEGAVRVVGRCEAVLTPR